MQLYRTLGWSPNYMKDVEAANVVSQNAEETQSAGVT